MQLLKTEILNNTNLNFNLNIKADKILQNKNFVNIILNSKIHEGLIDVDKTKFSWKNHANFNLSNSLIYLDENKLFLDGKLIIDIFDVNEIYKFLLTPKKYRLGIKKIELNINYNFDKKTINLADIMIDGKTDNDVNEVLKNIIFKKDNLQNKVHIKKILNAAIKSYAG